MAAVPRVISRIGAGTRRSANPNGNSAGSPQPLAGGRGVLNMALQVLTADKIASGNPVALGMLDDAFIGAGVTVASTNSFAIHSSGIGRNVTVQGTVLGMT